MKDPNDHIKKLFSDFEPEADDASIQQGWEEARYFLPPEKKRRRFIFWKYAGPGLAFLALVLLPFSWYFYNTGTDSSVVQKNETIKNPNSGAASEKYEHSFKAESTPFVNKPPFAPSNTPARQISPVSQTPPLKNQAPVRGDETIIAEDKKKVKPQATIPANTAPATAVTFVPPATKQIPPANLYTPPGIKITDVKHENNSASIEQNVREENRHVEPVAVEPIVTDAFVLLPMREPVLPFINDSNLISTLTPILPLPLPLKGKFIVDVFAGGAWSATQLRYFKYDDQQAYNLFQPSFGALAGYRFKNKVSVLGQFVFLQNKIIYSHILEAELKVLKKPTISSLGADTLQYYVKTSTVTQLKFSPAYNITLGFEYPVWNNRKTEISASLLLNLGLVKYSYGQIYAQDTDTLTYPITKSSGFVPPIQPASPATPVNTSFSESVKSAGLMPGIAVSYNLYKNFSLIAKPSYLLQLTEKKKVVQNLFDLQQNTFFMHVGIRFKW